MRSRPRRRTAALGLTTATLALVVAVPPATAGAADSPEPPSRCEALRGRDLAPGNPRLKLVRLRDVRADDDGTARRGTALYGCTGRLGHVRRLGFSGVETSAGVRTTPRFTVEASGGTWIVGRSRSTTPEGEDAETWSAYDVVSQRSYGVWQHRAGIRDVLPAPTDVAIEDAGRTAVIHAGRASTRPAGLPPGATVAVATLDARGMRAIVDAGGPEIGPRSLRLTGSIVTWTHGDETRSADVGALPGLLPAGGHPVDCGVSTSGNYRLQAARGTPCAFATRTYAAFVAFVEGDAAGFPSAIPRTFGLTVQSPATGRMVDVRGRAIPRAHGEFDFSFVSVPAGLAVRFNNLTLP